MINYTEQNEERNYLTKEELEDLKVTLASKERQLAESMEDLKKASEEGDIRENSAFDTAQQQVVILGKEISELENTIKNTTVRELQSSSEIVVGSSVHLEIYEKENKVNDMIIKIVSKGISDYTLTEDGDFDTVKVSEDTPVAFNILGRVSGDFEMLGVNGVNRKYKYSLVK